MKNIVWHNNKIDKESKESLLKQKSFVLWFSGLSGSGKSTIAVEVEKKLFQQKKTTMLLDGDNIRHGLNSDLGFSKEDREENLRRIREVSKLFYTNGIITLVSFISPFKKDRQLARELIDADFIEVFVDCSLEECERRDVKGLYKKARAGEIQGFTGIDQPYEKPESPEITINTQEETLKQSTDKVIEYLMSKKYI